MLLLVTLDILGMDAVAQVLNVFLKFPLIYGRGTTITFDKRVFLVCLMWQRDEWSLDNQKFNNNLECGWFSPTRFQIRKKGKTPKFESNTRSLTPNGDFIFSSDLALFRICYIFLYWVCSILDIDECREADAVKMNNCHLNASCINTQGSYNCSCNPTYIGDGFNCESTFVL